MSKKISPTDQAMKKAVKDGIVEEYVINGETKYRLTGLGKDVSKHLKSDSSKRN